MALSVTLQQFQNSLVLHSLRIKLDIISTIGCDFFNHDVAQELGNVKLAFTNLLACDEQIVANVAEQFG